MKYTILLSRQAEKYYKKLRGKIKTRVRESLLELENSPFGGKPLHGDLKTNYSLRVDKLRLMYIVIEKSKTIYIVAIGPRNTVYE